MRSTRQCGSWKARIAPFLWTSSSARPKIFDGAWQKETGSCARLSAGARCCMRKLTAAWIRKAESDFRVAKSLAGMRPPAHDEVCFHAQQAAEKFFKALLQEWGLPVPKIHELDNLLAMLLPRDATLQVVRRGLHGLSRFAVDY